MLHAYNSIGQVFDRAANDTLYLHGGRIRIYRNRLSGAYYAVPRGGLAHCGDEVVAEYKWAGWKWERV